MLFAKDIPKRDLLPIANQYEIFGFGGEDLMVAVYYVEPHKCQVLIRRHDESYGWDKNLMIKIKSIEAESLTVKNKWNRTKKNNSNQVEEIISIGSSNYNFKKINIYTKIDLQKIEIVPQLIPRHIIQTTLKREINNIFHQNSINSFIDQNPEYTYSLYNDIDSREFVKNNFDLSVLQAYDKLYAGTFKADLFRYCYLYINGGCYFDCKQILRVPIRFFVKPDDQFLVCKDIGRNAYFNAVICSVPNNSRIKRTIDYVVNRIHQFHFYYNRSMPRVNNVETILSLTGPAAFYQSIHNHIQPRELAFTHVDLKFSMDYMNLSVVDRNNQILITKNYRHFSSGAHYAILWKEFRIVYQNYQQVFDFHFYIPPHTNNDTFAFHWYTNDFLLAERIDRSEGWGASYELTCFYDGDNKKYKLHLPNSESKIVPVEIVIPFDKEKYKLPTIDNQIELHPDSLVFDDRFDFKVIVIGNQWKWIIRRIDDNCGWGQDLKVNVLLKPWNEKKTVGIGNSSGPYKIIYTESFQ